MLYQQKIKTPVDFRNGKPHHFSGPIGVVFLLAFFIQCNIPIVTSDPSEIPYQTAHFRIYYAPADFSRSEIEEVGLRKEAMLAHVNGYLGTDFDLVITTTIADTIATSRMYPYTFQTHEQTSYARYDNGHEMAHVVSIHEWGFSSSDFLVEGVADAAQYRSHQDAIADYAYSMNRFTNRLELLDTSINHLWLDITENEFTYKYSEYVRAGAFVDYLHTVYGISKLTAWWRATVTSGRTHESLFFTVYNDSLSRVITDFSNEVKSRFTTN